MEFMPPSTTKKPEPNSYLLNTINNTGIEIDPREYDNSPPPPSCLNTTGVVMCCLTSVSVLAVLITGLVYAGCRNEEQELVNCPVLKNVLITEVIGCALGIVVSSSISCYLRCKSTK